MFSCLNCGKESPKVLKLLSGTPFNYFNCLLCKKTIHQLNCTCGEEILSLEPLFFGKKMFCKKCEKSINIVPCPKCKQINMWNGDYSMGSTVTCLACKNVFQQVACAYCSESNFWNVDFQKNYFYRSGVSVQCYKCMKSFQHVTCPFCVSPNYFKECNLSPGKAFICDKCKTPLVHVRCRRCSFNEFFKKEDNFMFGKIYSCKKCKMLHTIFPCLNCNKTLNIPLSEEKNNILKFPCLSKECKEFYLYQCKFCLLFSYSFLPNSLGCTKDLCKSCKKINSIYFCTICKGLNFCECSITNNSKHECTKCNIKKEVANSKYLDSTDGLCIMDLTRKIDTVFIPCGHACYCNLCFDKLQTTGKDKCPMCNEKRECIKLFL